MTTHSDDGPELSHPLMNRVTTHSDDGIRRDKEAAVGQVPQASLSGAKIEGLRQAVSSVRSIAQTLVAGTDLRAGLIGKDGTLEAEPICWAHWQEWGACSVSCGNGTRLRLRNLDKFIAGGKCEPKAREREDCSSDCQLSCDFAAWGEWSQCDRSCGTGQNIRARGVLDPGNQGNCSAPLTEQQERLLKQCITDCKDDAYDKSERDCAKACKDEADDERERVSLTEQQDCNTQPCPENCEWSGWGTWSICSATCGPGSMRRHRTAATLPLHGGEPCHGDSDEVLDCDDVGGSCPAE